MKLVRLVLLISLCSLAPAASAQKLYHKPLEDPRNGFRLLLPKWQARTLSAEADGLGMLYHFDSDGDPEGGRLLIVRYSASAKSASRRSAQVANVVITLLEDEYPEQSFGDWIPAEVNEERIIEDQRVHHMRWRYEEHWVDAWRFPRDGADLGLIYFLGAKGKEPKAWFRLFAKSAGSFESVPRLELDSGDVYGTLLAYHSAEVAPIAGWRVVATPSEKFIVKTSHPDPEFVEDVIDRLERSRELFEQDFPPGEDFRHVSVVRLCSSESEFHRYGGTGEGVMGWFSPKTTELVLYDAQEVDRNMTFAVMTHEAFHQYCFFLFERSEAHRWFDEGHGDYYGGVRWTKRGRVEVGARMPSGLDRLEAVRELVRREAYGPMDGHLEATSTAEWRKLGGYAQSWSIVYMLRQGMRGNVHRRVWREEYGAILPAYVEALRAGFEEAYGALDAPDESGASHAVVGRGPQSDDLDPLVRAAIWRRAHEASWGKIDLVRFEEDWKQYVKKHLR